MLIQNTYKKCNEDESEEDEPKNEDDDFSVDDLDNLIEKVYNACYWVENLLDWVKLNDKMKSAITNIALEDKMWFGDSLMRILKVFGDNNESHVFTFNQILKLISLRLDEDYLQNFINLKNCFTYFCADDINYILKYNFFNRINHTTIFINGQTAFLRHLCNRIP